MSYEPAYSPWGLIQTRKTLCPGFFDVSCTGTTYLRKTG